MKEERKKKCGLRPKSIEKLAILSRKGDDFVVAVEKKINCFESSNKKRWQPTAN